MVRLYVFLALTLATGSTLACSDKYLERRDIPTSDFQSRELDDVQNQFERDLCAEEFSMREYPLDARDTFDDLETREPSFFGALTHIGESAVKSIAKSKLPKIAAEAAGPGKYAKAIKIGAQAVKVGRKVNSGKIGGKLERKFSQKAAEKLGRTKLGGKVSSKTRQKVTAQVVHQVRGAAVNQVKQSVSSRVQQAKNRLRQDVQRARTRFSTFGILRLRSRALAVEDLSQRDLDVFDDLD
jgi:hypothetical protein